MKSKVLHIINMVAAVALFASCKPEVPSQFIQPDDMEDLIYDYHIAQGVAAQQDGNADYNRRLAFDMVLKEHGVTQAEFDSSLVYYYTRADRFQDVYKNVQSRLNKEAEKYGAAVNEFRSLVSNSTSRDTIDVWGGQRMVMLFNDRPYHLYMFTQEADTTFHEGDSFLMSFDNTWLMQNGNRQAVAYVSVTYANDSTSKAFTTITSSGPSSLRIPYCKERVKSLKGFIMCGLRPSTDHTNNLCLLFINNIQLAKFHNKIIEQPAAAQKPMIDTARILKPDSAQYDSLRRPMPHPSNKPMTVGELNRMRQGHMIKQNLKPNN